ncbi:hypothetical protein LPJ66_004693, partial [Kickxella alabastrina]
MTLLGLAYVYSIIARRIEVFGVGTVHSNVNTTNCYSFGKDLPAVQGCESIQIDSRTGLAYMACGNRGARTRWIHMGEEYNTMYEQFSDHILVMDEKNNVHSLDILDRNSNTRELIPFTQDFRIHGFDIYHDDLNPTELTFMFVNHQRSGSGISIFKHQLNTTFIEHIKTVKSPLLYHPNDVTATSRSTFYATNDLKYAPGIMRRIEILLGMPWSHVVYYGPSGMFSKAKTGLAYPNGIARSRDGRLIYVAASSEPSVMAFLASDDGELELVAKKVFDGFVPDNISADARSGHLLVAGFLNVFEMFRYNRE